MALFRTWARVTSMCWLVITPVLVVYGLLFADAPPISGFLLALVLAGTALSIAGKSVECPPKPLSSAIVAALVPFIAGLVYVDRSPLDYGSDAWIIGNVLVTFCILLMLIHAGLEMARIKMWALAEFIAPVVVLGIGTSSALMAEPVADAVALVIPPLVLAAAASGIIFALVFESGALVESTA